MAAAEFSVKVSGAAAAAEWSALKWPPSLAASSRVVQNGGRRRSRVGRPFFSISSALQTPGKSWPLLSLPVADGVEGKRQCWPDRRAVMAGWQTPAGPRPWRTEARVCSDGEGARLGPRAPRREARGPAGRARPLARDQRTAGVPEPGLPAGRCVGPGVGGAALWGGGKERVMISAPFVRRGGRGEAVVSPRWLYGAGGGPLGGGGWAGGRLPAWRTKSWAPGRRGRPQLLLPAGRPAALRGGCRKHFPNLRLGGRNAPLFCSQEGKNGAEVPAAML